MSGSWNVSVVQQLFVALATRDKRVREQTLEYIVRKLEEWTKEPKAAFDRLNELVDSDHRFYDVAHGNCVPKLLDHLPYLLMLSIQCPFTDVREKCTLILEILQNKGVKVPKPVSIGPSSFIPTKEVLSPYSDNPEIQLLFIEAFLQNNRLDHITQVIGHHPHYLELFLRTQHFILKGDGPLPYDYRHYIAIMAAARHRCTTLVNLQKQEFLLQQGNERWLRGLDYIPQKLKDLAEINKILAHQPWLINRTHIEKLTKGKDNWSLSEVVHAIVILAHFHSLCSFVFGSGVSAEIDQEEGHTFQPINISDNGAIEVDGCENSHVTYEKESSVEEIMQKMRYILEQRTQKPNKEERMKCFERVESQNAELPAGVDYCSSLTTDLTRFMDDPDFTYQDFARRGEVSEISTFRIQDYSWDDHGYSLVNRLYNDVGVLLDEKFKKAYNLTYNTMGVKNNVDTSMFRRAIWNYIQCIYGIRHDDYDYREVNELLERNLKTFIKTVCCYPNRTTKSQYDSVMKGFKHSEKVHVNLMMLEARMQAELLYALRAITHYMT
ncbi:sestrin-3 [Centruroides vittatus]|uniref:sestrin-3 n=1 Tax=Centruroides vittatus TaxID=120091 RepID=UPI003510498D